MSGRPEFQIDESESFIQGDKKKHKTLQNFEVSDSNRDAFFMAKQVAENCGTAINPLMICGPTGSGKTHLAAAIEREVRKNPEMKVKNMSCEELVGEIIGFLAHGDGRDYTEFYEAYEDVDLLILENVEILEGKFETQKAVARLIHYLCREKTKKTQLVMTAGNRLSKKNMLSGYLLSRNPKFAVCEIHEPEYELKAAFVQKAAAGLGITVSEHAIDLISKNMDNFGAIEAVLRDSKAYSDILGRPEDDFSFLKVVNARKKADDTEENR